MFWKKSGIFAAMKEMVFTLTPMFVCLFWSALLALDMFYERFRRARVCLLVFMLAATLLYWGHCVFFNHNYNLIPFSDTVYTACNLAVYPLFYVYVIALTRSVEHVRQQWLMLVPSVGAGLMVGILYALMSDAEVGQFVSKYLYGGHRSGLSGLAAPMAYVHDVCKALFALQVIPVFVLGKRHLRNFDQQVRNAYADTDRKTLEPIHWLLTLFALCTAASFIANLMGRRFFSDLLWLPSLVFSVFLFILGYLGYKQQFSIEDIEEDERAIDAIVPEHESNQELGIQIEQLMEDEKLYLQPNLKIIDLVQRLGTNRNYVYQAVNRGMGMSFTEYVNRKRVNYAACLIGQQQGLSMSAIAEQSGFTSLTSFYRNFRQYMGVGPKDYQNKLKDNE